MKNWQKSAVAVLALAAFPGPAHAANASCLSGEEAQAIALALLPEALEATAQTCAPTLPEGSLLKRADAPLFERYRASREPATPLAQSAIARITGMAGNKQVAAASLDLVRAMILPSLSKEIKTHDCGAINRMIELLEPLPPENLAGVFATILQITARDEARKAAREGKQPADKSGLNICPIGETR